MESQYFFNLIYFFGLLITFVSSQCPFGSSSAGAGTCVCLPGYTSTGSGSSLVCTSLCPVGSNCVVISKRTTLTGNEEVLNLIEVELYLGTTKLLSSSLDFSMSSTWGASSPASNCNNGVTSPSTHGNSCHTAAGDQNAWILINAGLQIFSKIIVYNRMDYSPSRVDVATLTMFNGATIINPAVTFSSLGSSLSTYTFYSIGFLCPVGSNCVVISKITTSGSEGIELMEVELYMGTTKLVTSSLAFSMSSTASDASGSWSASICNDGLTSTSIYPIGCITGTGDRNAWLLINAGSQSFSRVVVYNRNDCCQNRIDVATLTMFNGATIINPAVTFSSFGSGLATYTFYSIGFLCPTGNNCVVISKVTTSGDEIINLNEVELYQGPTKLVTSSLNFSMSSTYSEASGSWSALKCNDGGTSTYIASSVFSMCATLSGDRNAWLLINAGSQGFSKIIVYNRIDAAQSRIDVATLTMFNGVTITKSAVTFSSFGSGLVNYTFCSTGFTGSTCVSPCLANNYYNFLTNACTACPLGSTSTAGSAVSCDCAINYASSGYGSTLVCTACPEDSSSTAGASSCTYTPGYYNSHIANLTNQITALNNIIFGINGSISSPQIAISSLSPEINEIKRNLTNLNSEISKMKVTLQKLSATMTRQRKREKSKIKEL